MISISYLKLLFVVCFQISSTQASKTYISIKGDVQLFCSGVYAKYSIPGNIDPFIEVNLQKPVFIQDPDFVTLGIFSNKDVNIIGKEGKNGQAILDGVCKKEDQYHLIFREKSSGVLVNKVLSLGNLEPTKVAVERTDYFCVYIGPIDKTNFINGSIVWQNPFGDLAAAEYWRIPFYSLLVVFYSSISILWLYLFIKNRQDRLLVQYWLTGLSLYLVFEMVVQLIYSLAENRKSESSLSKFLLVAVAIMSAFRNTLSFFCFLIVSMGYSVVRPSLGKSMLYCKILAVVHFFFAALYVIGTTILDPEKNAFFILLSIFPLSITFTIFMTYSMGSVNKNIEELSKKSQTVKAAMYKRLSKILYLSLAVILLFVLMNSIIYAPTSVGDDMLTKYWPYRWILFDGWLYILYMTDFALILWWWRPTEDNKRFAMSVQLAQTDEYALDEVNSGIISNDDDFEANKKRERPHFKSYDNFNDREQIFAISDESSEDEMKFNQNSI